MSTPHDKPRFFDAAPTRNTTAQPNSAEQRTPHKGADLVASAGSVDAADKAAPPAERPDLLATRVDAHTAIVGQAAPAAAGLRPDAAWSVAPAPDPPLTKRPLPGPMFATLERSAAAGRAWCDELDAAAPKAGSPPPASGSPAAGHRGSKGTLDALRTWAAREGKR